MKEWKRLTACLLCAVLLMQGVPQKLMAAEERTGKEEISFAISYGAGSFIKTESDILDKEYGTIAYEEETEGGVSRVVSVAITGNGSYFAKQKAGTGEPFDSEIVVEEKDGEEKIKEVVFYCPKEVEAAGTLEIEMLTDSTAPKISINGEKVISKEKAIPISPEDNASVRIKIEAADAESGVKKIEYAEENGTYAEDTGKLTKEGEAWYYQETVSRPKKLYFRVSDYYGNSSEAAVQIKVDKEAPRISLEEICASGVEELDAEGVHYWGEAKEPVLEFSASDENGLIMAEYSIRKKGEKKEIFQSTCELESAEAEEGEEPGDRKELKLDGEVVRSLENGDYEISASFQDKFQNTTEEYRLYECTIHRSTLKLRAAGEAASLGLKGACTASIGGQEVKKEFQISEGVESGLCMMNQGEVAIAFNDMDGLQILKVQAGQEDITGRYRDHVLSLDQELLGKLGENKAALEFTVGYVREFTVCYEDGKFRLPEEEGTALRPEIGSVNVSADRTKLEVSGKAPYFAKQKAEQGEKELKKEIVDSTGMDAEGIEKVIFSCPESVQEKTVIVMMTDTQGPEVKIKEGLASEVAPAKVYVDKQNDFIIPITATDRESGIKKVEYCEQDCEYGEEDINLYEAVREGQEEWHYLENTKVSKAAYIWASDHYGNRTRAAVQIIVDHEAPVIIDKDVPGAIQPSGMVSKDDPSGNHYWARSDTYRLGFQVREDNPPIQADCTITSQKDPKFKRTFQTQLIQTSENPVSAEGGQTWEMELELDTEIINTLEDGIYQLQASLTDDAGNRTEPDQDLTYAFHMSSQEPVLVREDRAEEYWLNVPADAGTAKEIQASIKASQPIAELSYAVTSHSYTGNQDIWDKAPEKPEEAAWQEVSVDAVRLSTENAEADITFQLPAGNEDGTTAYYLWVRDALGHTTRQQVTCHFDRKAPEIDNFQVERKRSGTSAMRAFQYLFGTFLQGEDTLLFTMDVKDSHPVSRYKEEPSVETVELYYMEQDCATPDDQEQGTGDNGQNYQELDRNRESLQKIRPEQMGSLKENGTRSCQFRLKVNRNNKFYKLYFVATDRAGNHRILNAASLGGSGTSPLVMVDDKKPVISSQLQESCAQADYQVTRQNKQMRWYQGGRKLAYDLSVTDKESGIFSIGASINGTAVTTDAKGKTLYDSSTAEDFEDLARETGFSYVIQPKKGKAGADGGYKVELRAEDNAGNVRKVSDQLYVDEDAPVISKMTFDTGEEDTLATVPVQYGYFFQKKTEVTVYATDYIGTGKVTGSGVAFIHYQLMPADGSAPITGKLTVKEGKDGVCTAQFTVPEGFKGQLELKAEDQVGQSSPAYNPKGAVVETPQEHSRTSKAEILLPKTAYRDSEGNPLYSGDIELELDTADSRSGLKQNVWSLREFYAPENLAGGTLDIASVFDESQRVFHSALSGDEGWEVPGALELNLVSRAGKKMTVSSDTNHLAAALQITDQAGNTSAARPRVFSIDKTAPAVQVKYDNNEAQNQKYYKEKRTATVTVTDANFSPEDCEFILTGPKPEISEWKHQPGEGCNGNVHTAECSYTCQVAFTEDGDYIFAFRCKDLAGHTAAYQNTDEFTIDTAKPVIRVSYDNNSASSGSYYSKARTATLEIEDKNFDPARTQIEITAQKDGALAEAPSVSQFTQNGDIWSATVRYAEDGDYTFHMASTDQAGNPADDYARESFTIDQTPPSLTIQGVEDHSANKGTVAPAIRTGDINLDEGSLTVTLAGANHGPVAYEAKKQQTEKDIEIHMADFKYTQENDDLYTLTVQVADRAGNKAEQTCTFSVNRFGSVYLLEEQTSQLVDQFYTNQEQEVVITEYNVDTLQFGEISYSLDGTIVTLEKGKDYEVESQTDEGSWKKYEYHVLAKNFQQEGSYVVSLYSEDLAQNKSSNKVKGKEVAFVVDKTKPTIVVAGVEDQGQYVDASRNITVDTQDNILLESVGVYTDGQKKASAGREELLAHDGQVNLSLTGSNQSQELHVEARDAAGNVARSADIRFLITKNLLVQWTSNLPLCVGSITATAAAGAAGVLGLRRRKLRFKR